MAITMDTKFTDIYIERNILFIEGHIIETDSIIGISTLWAKQPDSLTRKFFYFIYTTSNQIEITVTLSNLEAEDTRKGSDFKNGFFKAHAAVETILKSRGQYDK
jgi:hypothetical protein